MSYHTTDEATYKSKCHFQTGSALDVSTITNIENANPHKLTVL